MQCPPKIAEIVCEILRMGLLRIRYLGSQDPQRCVLEADHLHNLPGLLAEYKPELLEYYWWVERTGYIKRCLPNEETGFEPLWRALAKHVTLGASQTIAD